MSQEKPKWVDEPKPTDLEMAFGSMRFLPDIKTVPQEFHSMNNIYHEWAASIFFGHKPKINGTVVVRPGFDKDDVVRKVQASLASWTPKHEHKMAGVAYMLSQAFEIVLDEEVKT